MPHLRALKQRPGKQVVYRRNGDPRTDEVVLDRTGAMPFRRVGELITLHGRRWKVNVVRDDLSMSRSAPSISIHRVFLTDKF